MSEFEQVQPATAVDYNLSKPALLFASSPGRMRRAEDALVATGVRLVGSCSIEDAARRLEAQASLGLAWVELGEEDDPPSIRLEGSPQRTVAPGTPLTLDAFVVDDGRPSNRPSQSGSNARVEGPLSQAVVRLDRGVRLGVIWVVYRGDATAVTFEPRKVPVVEGKASTKVTFSAPGTYTLRAYADDGIFVAAADVNITVR